MNITNPYNPKQGLFIISPAGSQKYTERLDSYSQILNNLYVSTYNDNNKYCIDSCWESGNIYYANYDTGYVKKIRYDGTEIASLSLTNPFMVSVIQNSISMNSIVTYPPQSDQGCWIADKGTGKIIKTDKNLNVIASLSGIVNPICIKSDIDGGCYVLDSASSSFIKISSDAVILATKSYASFIPAVTNFIDIAIDAEGWVWLCANDMLYNLVYNTGMISQQFAISPLGSDDPLSSSSQSSSESHIEEEKHIGCIDVDRNVSQRYLYVGGGNSREAFVLKYDFSGNLIAEKEYYDISFPYVLKVIQGMGSDSLYVLEDSAKWDDYGYGSSSSSSSSSSTEIRSSSSSSGSSSSSSSTEIRSSSSSSSSSSGCLCSSYTCSWVSSGGGDSTVCSRISGFSFVSHRFEAPTCDLWLRVELKASFITPLVPKSQCIVRVFGSQTDALNNINIIVQGSAIGGPVPPTYTITFGSHGSVVISTSLASGVSIAKMTCV